MKIISFSLLIMLCTSLAAQNVRALHDSALVYMGPNWAKALPFLEQAEALGQQELSEQDTFYLKILHFLAWAELKNVKYAQAEAHFIRGIELMKKNLPVQAGLYYKTIGDLGYLYYAQENPEKAFPYFEKADSGLLQVRGPLHREYRTNRNYLALNYQMAGDMEKALALFEKLRESVYSHEGKENNEYLLYTHNIALIYKLQGKYDQALPLYLEITELGEKVMEPYDNQFISWRNNLARLYKEMGEFDRAMAIYDKLLGIVTSHHGPNNIQNAVILNNLASLHITKHQEDKAIGMLKRALDVILFNFGESHSHYGQIINNIGVLFMRTGQFDSAEQYVMGGLEHTRKYLGEDHPYYPLRLINAANFYIGQSKFEEALPLAKESVERSVSTIGTEHFDYMLRIRSVAYAYMGLNQPEKAVSGIEAVYHNLNFQIRERFPQLTDNLQKRLWGQLQPYAYQINCAGIDFPYIEDFHKLSFNQQLWQKGLLQGHSTQLLHSLRTHPDSLVQGQFQQWEKIHTQLVTEYQKAPEKRIAGFDSLKNEAEELELELANHSKGFRQARKNIDWKDVQANLKEGEAVIEFSHFPYTQTFRGSYHLDSIMYVAYILRPNDTAPKMVFLCLERELQPLIPSGIPSQEALSLAYHTPSRGIRPSRRKNQPSQKDLYDIIWQPMDSLLQGHSRIYFSPSGLLHRVNLDAISGPGKTLLSDRYDLVQLESSRSLAFASEWQDYENRDALLMGGIAYDQELEGPLLVSRGAQLNWHFLPGTEVEVHKIQQLLDQANYQVELKKGQDAREEVLSGLQSPPRIIHIASHGYFFPEPGPDLPGSDSVQLPPVQRSEHPLVRAGLILAGANHAWAGYPVPEGQEDGILTAYEISRMDLSNTELVVLSACETGLGDIQGNEGVYGLQRAFKIAGARYILMSLWQVPDQETQELMTIFYEEWLGGQEIRTAFKEAQRQMRKKYKDPYLWAGFVLVE